MESYPMMKKHWKMARIVKQESFTERQWVKLNDIHYIKADADWICENVHFNKTFFYKRKLCFIKKEKQKTDIVD